jgi:Mg2+-importing ATPase
MLNHAPPAVLAGMAPAIASTDWRAEPLAALLARLDATPQGLDEPTAARRLETAGPNVVAPRAARSPALDFILRFRNPLVLLLLVSSLVLGWTGDAGSMAIILVMICASVVLDFVQEHRAERTLARLQATVAGTARVLRSGTPRVTRAAALVPGDVVELVAGDIVPADARLVSVDRLFVNEAALTGEPYAVEKRMGPGEDDAVYMGSTVASGTARALVCATGAATRLGSLGGVLAAPPPLHPLERGMRRFGAMILRLTLFLVLFVMLVNALLHRPALESFLFAVALAVGLTPELLPMIVSVTLARGALRLASAHVIVKRPSAIYALGGMDVLCTDKTGTLTKAVISVAGHVDGDGNDSARTLALAACNARCASGVRSPLDDALLACRGDGAGCLQKLDEQPFDFQRRRVTVLVAQDGAALLVAKGAPEDVLPLCVERETPAGPVALDAASRDRLQRAFERYGDEGFRVLGVATRTLPAGQDRLPPDAERDLVFAGFVLFQDPPLPDAAPVLAGLARAGVAVKILTGDNERVARHVCAQIGLPVSAVVPGSRIDGLGDDGLAALAAHANLFCRVSPVQKSRVIAALQRQGRTVGFMGDGINDAPALHVADIGISVQGAAGVAREAADVILLRGRLGVVRDAVLEGRRTCANIVKYLMMATSSNFGNMLSMAAASAFMPFLPLLPVQILLNNLLYDVSEIPIPLDRVDEGDLRRPRVLDIDAIRRFMLVLGPVSSAFDLLTFGVLLWVLQSDMALFRTGWFIESIATQVLVIFVIRTRRSPLASWPHPALAATSLAVVCLAVALPFTPLGPLVGLVRPPPVFFPILLGLVATYLVLAELAKRRFIDRSRGRARVRSVR